MNGYAVRNDGKGWRSVESEADLLDDETFQIEQPEPIAISPAVFEILNLESQITPRRIREAVLGLDGGWLANIEKEIKTLREIL